MNLQKNRGVNHGIRRGGVRTVTPSCEGHGGAVTNRARRYKKRGFYGNFAAKSRRNRAAQIQHAAPQPNLIQVGGAGPKWRVVWAPPSSHALPDDGYVPI